MLLCTDSSVWLFWNWKGHAACHTYLTSPVKHPNADGVDRQQNEKGRSGKKGNVTELSQSLLLAVTSWAFPASSVGFIHDRGDTDRALLWGQPHPLSCIYIGNWRENKEDRWSQKRFLFLPVLGYFCILIFGYFKNSALLFLAVKATQPAISGRMLLCT